MCIIACCVLDRSPAHPYCIRVWTLVQIGLSATSVQVCSCCRSNLKNLLLIFRPVLQHMSLGSGISMPESLASTYRHRMKLSSKGSQAGLIVMSSTPTFDITKLLRKRVCFIGIMSLLVLGNIGRYLSLGSMALINTLICLTNLILSSMLRENATFNCSIS